MSQYIVIGKQTQRPRKFRTLATAMRALMELKGQGQIVDKSTENWIWKKTEACYEHCDGMVLSDLEFEEAVSDSEYEFRD